MERLKRRVIILGVAFLACGLAFQSMASAPILHDGKVPDEEWLIGIAPRAVGNFTLQLRDAGPDVSYRMDEATYNELKPYGIVARKFFNGNELYDTVVIMSSKKYSFHDPSICFTAQNWVIEDKSVVPVETKTHGTIHVTMAKMIHTQAQQRTIAVYFYRGPKGFVATPQEIKSQMFWHQFFNFRDAEGVFYRIMPDHTVPEDPAARKVVEDQLKTFISDFLEAAHETSKGLI